MCNGNDVKIDYRTGLANGFNLQNARLTRV